MYLQCALKKYLSCQAEICGKFFVCQSLPSAKMFDIITARNDVLQNVNFQISGVLREYFKVHAVAKIACAWRGFSGRKFSGFWLRGCGPAIRTTLTMRTYSILRVTTATTTLTIPTACAPRFTHATHPAFCGADAALPVSARIRSCGQRYCE